MKTMRMKVMVAGWLLGVMVLPLFAQVRLPAIIGDNMVLQRDIENPIWGWAQPGEKVEVRGSWHDSALSTRADAEGKWMVKIPAPETGGPYTLTIKGKKAITLKNILCGEVWICSGQSNMQMEVKASWHKGAFNYQTEIKEADYPNIHLFSVRQTYAPKPQADCAGVWSVCSPETVAGFSAVGYFFGRDIYKELNVPVGLIHTSWGGTPSEAWTSAEFLKTHPDYVDVIDQMKVGDVEKIMADFEEQLQAWKDSVEANDGGNQPTENAWSRSELSETDWQTMEIPNLWEDKGLPELDGIVWFRKTIEIPKSWANKDLILNLGPIDDVDTTWFNGQEVGTLDGWDIPRKYTIPGRLVKAGANQLVVRVIDYQGGGGIYGERGQYKLAPTDKSTEAISLAGPWKYRVGIDFKDCDPRPQQPPAFINQNSPTGLYNGMIAPLIPYGIRGAIWYQGESNAGRAYQYRTLFPLMIKNWRHDWSQGEFPFYFVQIAPYNYGTEYICAELREAQFMTLSLANTGMAVTLDIGNIRDIHPRNKQLVGRRLALWALAKTYGQDDIVYSGPLYRSMQVEEDKIRIYFDHVGSGLMSRNGDLTHFTIAGADQVFHDARAEIDDNTVVVFSSEVSEPIAVRYAWKNNDVPNLYNFEWLPASSFRTDDWPGVTKGNK
ncbi:MAG: hypothetical protein JW860_02260 [Sedimentisphaerales bacterium]|nr:hypothetical protein [Sedimentisphaerales bacterium]